MREREAKPQQSSRTLLAKFEVADEAVEIVCVYAQQLCRFSVITRGLFKSLGDQLSLKLPDRFMIAGRRLVRGGFAFKKSFGKIFGYDQLGRTQHHRTLNCVLQLPHIPGPIISA